MDSKGISWTFWDVGGQATRLWKHYFDSVHAVIFVIDATYKCISDDIIGVDSFNIGSGESTSVSEIATQIVNFFDSSSIIKNTGEFRFGDIRHNYADLTKTKKVLGFSPKWKFNDGLKCFLDWASSEPVPELNFEKSLKEMADKGLFKRSHQA